MKNIAAILGVALMLVACGGGSPQGTVKDFFRNVEDGKLEEAAGLFSKATLSTVGLEKLKQGLQQSTREIDGKGGISKIEVLEHKTIGEVAEVSIKIFYGNGTEETESMDLILENGQWKLQPSGDK